MKKIFLCGVVVVMCLVAGCKKDGQSNKVYLLQQEITDNRADGGTLDTTTYNYDAQHRITTIINGKAPNETIFTLTYDADGRVATAKKLNSNGTLVTGFDFFYSTAATGYHFYGPDNSPSDTSIFTYNNNKQITKIQSYHSGSLVFTYDGRGNIETSASFAADGSNSLYDNISYDYDAKKNPFSDMPQGNLFLMYLAYTAKSTLINNVSVENADTYTYTYNADGFPTKASINTGTTIVMLYYNYQTL